MKNFLIITLFLNAFIFSCKVEELKTPPVVKTNSSSEIAATSAKIWGEVVEEGSSAATERGFVYSDKNPSPSTSDTKVVSGFGKGEFNVVISNLLPKTKYYFKAYASNQSGIAYGDAKDFTTIDDIKLPTLTTNIVTNITISGCTSGGSITSDGGATIIEKGIVYGTTANPTITNNKIISTGANNYSLGLSGLSDNTTYYIRAFATNSKGTNYGDQQVFTTKTSTLNNGLVAYYPLNGNSNDLSGNSNNGIINGAIPTTGKNGKENTAYLFNGISNFISLPKPFFNGSRVSQFSLSITFKFNKLFGAQSIWTKNGFWQGAGVSINPEGQIDFGSSIPTFQYQHSTSNLNVIEPNKWYNLILVYDNNDCAMYLNGIKIITLNVTKNQSGTIISDKKVAGFVDFGQNASGNSGSTNLFGCSNSVSTGNTTFMNGIIDDFRLYNRILTESEIIDLSNN